MFSFLSLSFLRSYHLLFISFQRAKAPLRAKAKLTFVNSVRYVISLFYGKTSLDKEKENTLKNIYFHFEGFTTSECCYHYLVNRILVMFTLAKVPVFARVRDQDLDHRCSRMNRQISKTYLFHFLKTMFFYNISRQLKFTQNSNKMYLFTNFCLDVAKDRMFGAPSETWKC